MNFWIALFWILDHCLVHQQNDPILSNEKAPASMRLRGICLAGQRGTLPYSRKRWPDDIPSLIVPQRIQSRR